MRHLTVALSAFSMAVALSAFNGGVASAQSGSFFTPADSPATAKPSGFGAAASRLNPANWKMPKMKMPSFGSLMPGQDDR
ncbi:MAG: hypothetical protein AAF989_15420, partial [Planctomycetota bacterium]